MKPLIKDGDIILDGTKTRKEAEQEAFKRLETIEEMLVGYSIKSLAELDAILYLYKDIRSVVRNYEQIGKKYE